MVMLTLLPDHSLKSLAEVLGPLPEGDVPAAWWVSTHPDVLDKYEQWRVAYAGWRDRFAELCEISGFDRATVKISVLGEDTLAGLSVPELKTHTWWRQTKEGLWVPRKRTKAEKDSQVTARFNACRRIPWVLNYVPGLPQGLWIPGPGLATTVYPVKVRRAKGRDTAVVAFVGADPDKANPAFEVSEHWSKMKLSTFHMLRERAAAAGG
jgi:hypothetical protein